MNNRVDYDLSMSLGMSSKLEEMSQKSHLSIAEVLRRSIALMDFALDLKKQGNQLAIINAEGTTLDVIEGL